MAGGKTDGPWNGLQPSRGTAVHTALATLPPELGAVLELAFFAGLDYRQVATRLHLPPETVTTRMRLALVALVVHLVHQEPSSIDRPDRSA